MYVSNVSQTSKSQAADSPCFGAGRKINPKLLKPRSPQEIAASRPAQTAKKSGGIGEWFKSLFDRPAKKDTGKAKVNANDKKSKVNTGEMDNLASDIENSSLMEPAGKK